MDGEDFGYQSIMKKKLHSKPKRTVQVKRMRRKKKHLQSSNFQK
jgi:hypothetical protein